ncbi:MAG TPA: hypothetical protein VFF98_06270 [Novosphingobium sp.]|nr:hypothetical protein [Novosphingobium sp.]
MGRLIDISWPSVGITVVAELADELNPEMCEEFWRCLPFKVLQAHPVVSGESLYAWAPVVSSAPVHVKERIIDCPVGRLRFSQSTGNKFSIQYGKGLEPLYQPVLGMVLPEYLHLLPKVGKEVWESIFWRKDEIFVHVAPHEAGVVTREGSERDDYPTELMRAFIDEANRIQEIEPEDLRAIRLGQVKGTGTFGQYFSAWDFAQNMLRDYINYTMYVMLRLADKQSPQIISQTIDEIDPPYTTYLGHSGLVQLEAFAIQMRDAVREAKDAEEVKLILSAFLRYGNRLVAWAYHYFPWHIGLFYNRPHDGQELPGRFLQAPIEP